MLKNKYLAGEKNTPQRVRFEASHSEKKFDEASSATLFSALIELPIDSNDMHKWLQAAVPRKVLN